MKKVLAILIVLSCAVTASAEEAGYSVKSGISFSQQWGLYIANVIEKDGKISNVVIDRLANGKSSKELHGREAQQSHNYGIKRVSSLNKDWWEQVAYYEDWVLKNGVDAVKYGREARQGHKDGHAENVDLISGATSALMISLSR